MNRKAKKSSPVPTWNFTLILSGGLELSDEGVDALFEAGCDDALAGSRDGVVFLDFDRAAGTFRDAVLSAIADVEKVEGVRVERVEPDELVTMAEIARRCGRSRENIRQLVSGLRGPGTFPPPIASLKQRSPLWRWTDVQRWLTQELQASDTPRDREAPALEDAFHVAAINAALDVRRHVADGEEALRLIKALIVTPRSKQGSDRSRRSGKAKRAATSSRSTV